jgi:alpha-ribazole phosphatase
MDIYLIRHTKTATEKRLCYGQSDVALSPDFEVDAQKLLEKLPDLSVECQVFSSPLSRCLQLAEKLSQTVTADKRLLELDFGNWENCFFDGLDSDVFRHWTEHYVDVSPPNGESFTDLCRRAASFWQEVVLLDREQVVIVTHAGVIRAILAHVLNLPLANAFRFHIDSGSIHKLQYINDYTFINYLNH